MALINEKQVFYINSNDRVSGTSEDFSVYLDFDLNKNYDSVCVLQCLIPQSYYLIRDQQNTFTLTEGLTTVTVTITPGNYSRRSFATHLGVLLTQASPNSWIYSVNYPNIVNEPDTGFYTYTVVGHSSEPSFQFDLYCYEAMGFDVNSTYTFSGGSLTSINVIKLSPEDQLFIHSDACTNGNGGGSNNILQDIYAGGASTYSSILWENFDIEATSKIFSNNGNVFRFTLTNESGQLLDLNGQNMTITIMLYKKNNIWALFQQFMIWIAARLGEKPLENE